MESFRRCSGECSPARTAGGLPLIQHMNDAAVVFEHVSIAFGDHDVHRDRIDKMSETELLRIRADIGMLFQESALFDSLTVRENVGYRLDEEMHLPEEESQRRVEEVLGFVGLREYINRMPSELS